MASRRHRQIKENMKKAEKHLVQFSAENQPSKEARERGILKRQFNRRLEETLLAELFKEDIEYINAENKKAFTSSLAYSIKRLKHIMCTSNNEKLVIDLFFKFMDRIFGRPQIHVEASVESENRNINYTREDIIKMILEAKQDKIIDVKKNEK